MPEARKQEQEIMTDEASAEWVSLNEATKLLGENREQVLQRGVAGTLQVKRFGRWTFVSRASIDRHLASVAAA
jgi:hypothetical protein